MYQSVLDLSNIELPCFKSQKNVQNYAGASVRSQAAHLLGCVLVHVIVQKGCGHGHTARMAWRACSWVLLRYTARMAWRAGLWVLLQYTARKACRACLWLLLRYTARMAGLPVGSSAVCRACVWVLRRDAARMPGLLVAASAVYGAPRVCSQSDQPTTGQVLLELC